MPEAGRARAMSTRPTHAAKRPAPSNRPAASGTSSAAPSVWPSGPARNPPRVHPKPAALPTSGSRRLALRTSNASVATDQPCTTTTPIEASTNTYSASASCRQQKSAHPATKSAPTATDRPTKSCTGPVRPANAETPNDASAKTTADITNASAMRSRGALAKKIPCCAALARATVSVNSKMSPKSRAVRAPSPWRMPSACHSRGVIPTAQCPVGVAAEGVAACGSGARRRLASYDQAGGGSSGART